jgi:diguanylate cyclase (GGDEF)-like protein/PAS domain S-box-containing protein
VGAILDLQTGIRVMLYLAASLQVVAAIVALLLVPVSGMRRSWIVICVALVLQAWRRIYALNSHATLLEAVSALAVSVLLLAGIIGIRAVFVSLRKTRRLLDREIESASIVRNRAGAAIVVVDPDGRVRDMNEVARELLHWQGRSVAGLDWFDTFVVPSDRDETRHAFRRLLGANGGGDEYVESALLDADGAEHTFVWHRRILRDPDGDPIGVRFAGVDMTDSTLLERELTFRSLLLDHTNDSLIVYRFDGTVVYANDTACAYRGVRRENIIGSDVRRFLPHRERDAFAVHLETITNGSCVTFETETVDGEGIVRPLESHTCPVMIGTEPLVVDVSRDITERREAEAAIRRMAYTDHLTGLPNRVLLSDRATLALARASRSGERLALLFMDLDRIKQANDTLGHAAGDELLRQVGERLAAAFREEDTVARIGGDEFVVLVRVADLMDAETAAQRLVSLMAEPFAVGGEEVMSSASVGVAMFPADGSDLDELMAKADAAMYVAKDEGRNRYRLHVATD